MIMYPPEKFDGNEWFILISLTLVLIIALLLPKRFPPVVVVFMMLFNVFIGQTVDYTIAVPPYNLYDVNDISEYEIFDCLLYFLLYPPTAYLVIYFYNKWRIKGLYVIAYILGCALITVGLEWLAVLFHVFKYNGWKLIYSGPVYFGVYGSNILMLRLTQYYLRYKGEMTNNKKKKLKA